MTSPSSSTTPTPSPWPVTNIFDPLPSAAADEHFVTLAESQGTVVERIVSYGQTTPADRWLRQERTEWVVLLRGRARLLFRGSDGDADNEIELTPGDAVTIPGGTEHRVTMTDPDSPTVWLAVHYDVR